MTGVNGIDYGDIVPRSRRTGEELPRKISRTGEGAVYLVSLDAMTEKDSILLVVPECYASIMTTADNSSLVRRSFITSDWALTDDAAD